MNTRSGLALLVQQYRALLRKSLLLSWRNRRATLLQLFSSLVFIFLIFCIQKAIEARFASSSDYKSVADPSPLVSPPIPPCDLKNFVKLPCFDFVWSGNDSARIRSIVAAIRANNPGRPIPSTKVCVIFEQWYGLALAPCVFGCRENQNEKNWKIWNLAVATIWIRVSSVNSATLHWLYRKLQNIHFVLKLFFFPHKLTHPLISIFVLMPPVLNNFLL